MENGNTTTIDELLKEEKRLERIRASKRKYAQRVRDELKAKYGTCLTEKQAKYNDSYLQRHHEEHKTYMRIYARNMREIAKKAKRVKRYDCECQTDDVLLFPHNKTDHKEEDLTKWVINVITI